MLRRLTLLLIPLAVFAAACGGSSNSAKPTATSGPAATATEVSPTAEPPTPIVLATQPYGGASGVLSAMNPLQILSGIQGGSPSQNVSPELASALLDASDLPSGFAPMGEFSFNLAGAGQMAANMFISGDIASGTFRSMAMSAVVTLPPDQLAALDSLRSLTDADLEQMRAATTGLGVNFTDLRVLSSSGLGDNAAGLHMVMDFSGMANAFGASDSGTNPFANGLAVDMYMFARGGKMHMAMVMWPADGSAGANARQLADALYGRVASSG
jgi:hypothetical protein